MIIDIHTHIFPEAIAKQTLAKLEDKLTHAPHSDGTYNGTLNVMEQAGIDISVNLPTMTSPTQFDSILRFAVTTNEKAQDNSVPQILSFGGMHPDSTNYKEELRSIANNGLKGVKIHPDYQQTYFDDLKYMRIMDYATALGLIIITHSGFDPVSPNRVHAPVDRVLNVLREVAPQKLILAHMGNMCFPEAVLEKLAGENVYFDTAMCLHILTKKQLTDIIKAHGSNRILFGTDLPWGNAIDYPTLLEELPLSHEEKENILWRNAKQLLQI